MRRDAGRSGRDFLLLGFAIAVALALAWYVRKALLIVYVSAVFAVVLEPAVEWLHSRSLLGWKPGRGTALLLLIALLLIFLGGMIAIAVPSIISNTAGFTKTMSEQAAGLQKRIHSIPLLRSINVSELEGRISSVLGNILPALGSATADVVTAILLIAYFILDGAALLKRLLRVFPPDRRERLGATLHRAAGRMRHWLAGQAMLMAILGGSSALVFGLMRLPYFYLLALFAGIANLVPLLGPLATVILAGLVAATQSWWDVLGVIIFYLVYQQVENAFLTPRIMKSQVQLPSAIVIVALLVGGERAGVAGALVAVPSSVLVAELAEEYLVWKPARAKDPRSS